MKKKSKFEVGEITKKSFIHSYNMGCDSSVTVVTVVCMR